MTLLSSYRNVSKSGHEKNLRTKDLLTFRRNLVTSKLQKNEKHSNYSNNFSPYRSYKFFVIIIRLRNFLSIMYRDKNRLHFAIEQCHL